MKNYKPEKEIILKKDSSNSIHSFWIRSNKFAPFWHFHPEIELTFISKGKGVRMVGDSTEPFSSNDLVLVGSNLPHSWTSIEKNSACEAIVIQFSSRIFYESSELISINKMLKQAEKGISFKLPSKEVLNKISIFNDKPDALKYASLIEILYSLQLDTSTSYLASEQYRIPTYNYKSQQRFEKVAGYVISNIDKKISLQEIASVANMRRESFSRWFRQTTGTTFIHYVNKTKVEVACHLLIHSDDHINQVAFKVGYDSQSQFHRSFKQIKEISPLKFRKLYIG